MTSWDNYTKDAEQGQGEWVDISDDLYAAMIKDIGEPETKPDTFNPGKERTQFHITWELSGDVPEGTTLRQWVTIPEGYINDGYLSEKSNLFKVMEALGFDLSGRFRVDPPSWQGLEARVLVENKPNKDGDLRPRITDVKAPRRKAADKPAPKREPVGAAAKRGGAPFGEDDEE